MNKFYVSDTEFILEDYNKNIFNIKSYDKIYTAIINSYNLNTLISDNYNDGDFIICDDYFIDKINFDKNLIYFIHAVEDNKNINTVLQIIDKLYFNKFNKSNKLIVIGGGIIQDICGFVSGIFKRGISWIYIPTTLLAMTDSCIGGKVGINHHSKNMLGMFVSPLKVLISDYFLSSLHEDMIISGLGESLKLAIIGGELETNNFLELYKKKDYLTIIKQSLVIKKAIIEYDELEKNERRVLNYGHTIGHAIEAATNFFIPHGIGVLFGMYFINKLFEIKNLDIINEFILNMIPKKYLLKFDNQKIITHIINDKKNLGNNICFIIPDNFGIFNIKFINIENIQSILNNILINY
jgi:3-dehydroquinate synthase